MSAVVEVPVHYSNYFYSALQCCRNMSGKPSVSGDVVRLIHESRNNDNEKTCRVNSGKNTVTTQHNDQYPQYRRKAHPVFMLS